MQSIENRMFVREVGAGTAVRSAGDAVPTTDATQDQADD